MIAPTSRRVVRAERVRTVQLLRERGMTQQEIAALLGLSRSTVSMYVTDPDGSQDRARKASYGGTCEGCGARTDGSNGPGSAPRLCAACTVAKQHDEREWTRKTIIEAFREFAAVMGRPPRAADSMLKNGGCPCQRSRYSAARIAEADRAFALGLRLPVPALVSREFVGGWRAAQQAAGLSITGGGTPLHRDRLSVAERSAPITATESFRRGEFVCPSCGEFSSVLYERTGWCGSCTRTAQDAA
jgi:hypothetical protein